MKELLTLLEGCWLLDSISVEGELAWLALFTGEYSLQDCHIIYHQIQQILRPLGYTVDNVKMAQELISGQIISLVANG